MIQNISIQNFKSIQRLTLQPKRVNLFIGKPASGKSNIIEALAFFSKTRVPYKDILRMNSWEDLFYDKDLERKVQIVMDGTHLDLEYRNGNFEYYLSNPLLDENKNYSLQTFIQDKDPFFYAENNKLMHNTFYYKFKPFTNFTQKQTDMLNPPFGDNLPQIISTRGEIKKLISEIFNEYNLKLGISPIENTIKVIKEMDGVIYDYPFVSISDTLQRIVFYITAIYSHSKSQSTLLFEEPESHVFPFYNKYLGEKIAMDSKQYFIATHNSPFLFSILQKINPEDLNIYITYYEDYQTKVYAVPQEKFSNVWDMGEDFFLNLDAFKE